MPKNTKAKSEIKEIKTKKASVISDYKNANDLLDIFNYNQSKSINVICASCKALGDIFAHFLKKDFFDTGKHHFAEEDQSKEDQFSSWLKEQFKTTCDLLCDNLHHEDSLVQAGAIEAMVTILQQPQLDLQPQGPGGRLMQNVLTQLLSSTQDQQKLIALLPVLLSARDGCSALPLCCLAHLKAEMRALDQSSTDHCLINFWRVIKQITSQDLDDKSKKMLTAVVCQFLKHKMPTSLYREILTGISAIMEKMSSPVRLADFLSESFNIGGAISLMSLHGLFILMHKYNLEYPDFYKKLYSMFEPQIFGAKYRARFLHLADLFLSSTHLPAYLVAAFAKRLARLSLHAPATALHATVPFILNLVARHPACDALLHKADVTDFGSDPFLPEEPDTAKCRALDSCLWELQTLEHHCDPTVAVKARKRRVAQEELGPLLEVAAQDIMETEIKKMKSEIPLTFIKATSLEMPMGVCL